MYASSIPGAVQKCDFCASQLDEGLEPSCAVGCLMGAAIFGDMDDPKSAVNRDLSEPRVRLREELGTCPSMYLT